eukprot:m.5328 g.5328  ORF g.5328 m.5328 type:complete len:481 (-) comp3275_c0_seq1:1946-3388(-)
MERDLVSPTELDTDPMTRTTPATRLAVQLSTAALAPPPTFQLNEEESKTFQEAPRAAYFDSKETGSGCSSHRRKGSTGQFSRRNSHNRRRNGRNSPSVLEPPMDSPSGTNHLRGPRALLFNMSGTDNPTVSVTNTSFPSRTPKKEGPPKRIRLATDNITYSSGDRDSITPDNDDVFVENPYYVERANTARLDKFGRKATSCGSYNPSHSLVRRGTVSEVSLERAPRSSDQIPDGPDVRGDKRKHCVLPTTKEYHKFHQSIRLISVDTMSNLLNGMYDKDIDDFLVVDCRFPFEYDGGHIQGAHNLWTMERMVAKLLSTPLVEITNGERIPIIFHCEFSSVRAPTMCKFLRDLDNSITFGLLDLIYPELYVMEGGYEKFFEAHPQQCTPSSYIRMKDKRFARENEQYENILSCSREQAKDLKWRQNDTVQTLSGLVREHGMGGLQHHMNRPQSPRSGLNVPSMPTSPRTPRAQLMAGNDHI